MAATQMIECPKCGCKIDLSQQISALVAEQSDKEVARKLAAERNKFAEEKKEAVQAAVERARADERTKAEKAKTQEIARLARENQTLEKKLQKAGENLEKQREQDRKNIEAEVHKAHREAMWQKELELEEGRKQLRQAREKSQELEQKLRQGSAQRQGIIAEVDLFRYLKQTLPPECCRVHKRGQGKKGTDVIVDIEKDGERIGAIIIDDKWATSWGTDWPEKIWRDMQNHNAHFAYIAANPAAFPAGDEELKQSGFGIAPCRKAGVRVWLVDRSNLALVASVIRDTAEKIIKMAEVRAIYGAGSDAVMKFQAYLTGGYETDLREKAKYMSITVRSLNDLHKKFSLEYERMMEALKEYWVTEKNVHTRLTSCFGPAMIESAQALPKISFERPE